MTTPGEVIKWLGMGSLFEGSEVNGQHLQMVLQCGHKSGDWQVLNLTKNKLLIQKYALCLFIQLLLKVISNFPFF